MTRAFDNRAHLNLWAPISHHADYNQSIGPQLTLADRDHSILPRRLPSILLLCFVLLATPIVISAQTSDPAPLRSVTATKNVSTARDKAANPSIARVPDQAAGGSSYFKRFARGVLRVGKAVLSAFGEDRNSSKHATEPDELNLDARIDAAKPMVYLNYVCQNDKSVYLRMHNNTVWHIDVITDDLSSPRKPITLRNGINTYAAPSDKEISLHYFIHAGVLSGQKVNLPEISYPDNGFSNWIASQDSILFSVPVEYLRKDLQVVVKFNYEWQITKQGISVAGSEQQVAFRGIDLATQDHQQGRQSCASQATLKTEGTEYLSISENYGATSPDAKPIRKLLTSLQSVKDDRETLATLFNTGDEQIGDLIEALHDPDRKVRLRAQIVIRYLGNETGMDALEGWYSKQTEIVTSGPITLPLRERDYKFINSQYLNRPAVAWAGADQYIFALALDGSPRAKALLHELEHSAGTIDDSTIGGRAIRLTTAGTENVLIARPDLAKSVSENAFFITTQDRPFTSAKLLGLNGAKDKALIEVYINRGRLAEEWYHVVLSKHGRGWKFFSITQVAVS